LGKETSTESLTLGRSSGGWVRERARMSIAARRMVTF